MVTVIKDYNEYLEFFVEDTGIGIPKAKHKHILNSFSQADSSTTRKYGGTGLGLSIVGQLINLMGGELNVKSTPLIGSCFSFLLLLPKAVNSHSEDTQQLHNIRDKRILIVDDNSTNRLLVEKQLAAIDINCEAVGSALEALDLMEKAHVDSLHYDLLILDMHMPEMDGMELASVIRNNEVWHQPQMIMLSSANLDVQLIKENKIVESLSKPVLQQELFDCLKHVFEVDAIAKQSVNGTTVVDAAYRFAYPFRILVAEDNPVNREVALIMLESFGLNVDTAEHGKEALDASALVPYDLILMDMQMPVMDGLEATKQIRRKEESGLTRSKLPIVALTANAVEGDMERCINAGMDGYLSKPFSKVQLYNIIAPRLVTPRHTHITNETLISEEVHEKHEEPMPIEIAALKAIAALDEDNAGAIVNKIIQLFLGNLASQCETLLNTPVRNTETIRSVSHSLKSSCANVGAKSLSDLCKKLEQTIGELSEAEVKMLISEIEMESTRVQQFFRDEDINSILLAQGQN